MMKRLIFVACMPLMLIFIAMSTCFAQARVIQPRQDGVIQPKQARVIRYKQAPVIQHKQVQVIRYKESNEDFANPERGFYIPVGTSASKFTPLDSAGLQELFLKWAHTPGGKARYSIRSTLLMREYTLDLFRDRPLSDSFLLRLDQDFNVVRALGLKMVLRFAYTNTAKNGDCPDQYKICPPYGDAPKAVVLRHIAQLTPLLRHHADVIAVLQEGFIGIWGENFYTDYFGDPGGNGPGRMMDSSWRDRNEVLHALLAALPDDRMVQVRTPQIKQKYVYGATAPVDSRPMDGELAFTGADAARIGFHNDCFLSGPDDYGTYYDYGSSGTPQKPANEVLRRYVGEDSRYVPVGGETCDDAYSPQNDCAPLGHAEQEMAGLHLSFLNAAYNNDVNNDWDSLGCMSSMQRRLGYRFVLDETTIPGRVVAGSSLQLDMRLRNIGYASPYNAHRVHLIFRNRQTKIETKLDCRVDVRRWYSGPLRWTEELKLPQNLAAGEYDLLLLIGDGYESLASRPAYNIRLANQEVWEDRTGYNDLGVRVTVQGSRARKNH